jgi:hypothetical protein
MMMEMMMMNKTNVQQCVQCMPPCGMSRHRTLTVSTNKKIYAKMKILFLVFIVAILKLNSCSSVYEVSKKVTTNNNSKESILLDNCSYKTDSLIGFIDEIELKTIIDSVKRYNPTFFESENIYFLFNRDSRTYEYYWALISNDKSYFSITTFNNSRKDIKLNISSGITEYWENSIYPEWDATMDSIYMKWSSYNDAPWSIGVSINPIRKNKYKVKYVFGQ